VPLFLKRSQLVGTWASPGNGRLVLRADGTAIAISVCGKGKGYGLGSLTGTWTPRPGRYSPFIQTPTGGILVESGGSNEIDEGGGDAQHAVLWMYRDAPGDSGICTLRKQ
jgi:hypothetical protein